MRGAENREAEKEEEEEEEGIFSPQWPWRTSNR